MILWYVRTPLKEPATNIKSWRKFSYSRSPSLFSPTLDSCLRWLLAPPTVALTQATVRRCKAKSSWELCSSRSSSASAHSRPSHRHFSPVGASRPAALVPPGPGRAGRLLYSLPPPYVSLRHSSHCNHRTKSERENEIAFLGWNFVDSAFWCACRATYASGELDEFGGKELCGGTPFSRPVQWCLVVTGHPQDSTKPSKSNSALPI